MVLCEWQASMYTQLHLCEWQACMPSACANGACICLLFRQVGMCMCTCLSLPQPSSEQLKTQRWAATLGLGTPEVEDIISYCGIFFFIPDSDGMTDWGGGIVRRARVLYWPVLFNINSSFLRIFLSIKGTKVNHFFPSVNTRCTAVFSNIQELTVCQSTDSSVLKLQHREEIRVKVGRVCYIASYFILTQ